MSLNIYRTLDCFPALETWRCQEQFQTQDKIVSKTFERYKVLISQVTAIMRMSLIT